MAYVFGAIMVALIVGGIVVNKDYSMPSATEGQKRIGRIGLWVIFPPLGLWRSYKHGADKRTDRIVEAVKNRGR